tara:strand:- start:248 stop:544 length:297 start_codon:yes stop_codon:yes gene_type:complete
MPARVSQDRALDVLRRQRKRDETVVQKDDFAVLLSTEQGRRTVWRILQQSLITSPVFSQNAMVMSSNAGKQELGLWLQSQLRDADQDNYLKMLSENDA